MSGCLHARGCDVCPRDGGRIAASATFHQTQILQYSSQGFSRSTAHWSRDPSQRFELSDLEPRARTHVDGICGVNPIGDAVLLLGTRHQRPVVRLHESQGRPQDFVERFGESSVLVGTYEEGFTLYQLEYSNEVDDSPHVPWRLFDGERYNFRTFLT